MEVDRMKGEDFAYEQLRQKRIDNTEKKALDKELVK
jgi:hypothetical protein